MTPASQSDPDVLPRREVALVTGAGSGLGRALALACARQGQHVLVTDLDAAAAQATADLITDAGGHAESAQLDVTDADAVQAFIDDAWDRLGGIDLLLNNAGVASSFEAQDIPPGHWRDLLDVNLFGAVQVLHPVYLRMAARPGADRNDARPGADRKDAHPARPARICNIASIFGLVPAPLAAPYVTSKFALVGLSLSLRAEAAPLDIQVTAACPGFIDTALFPADARPPGRLMSPDDAAARILQGIRRNRPLIVFPWYARLLWWLHRLSPALSDRLNRSALRSRPRSRPAIDA